MAERIVPPGVPGITFQTPLQSGITISDVPGPTGGILIKATSGASIAINDVGIMISNGKGAIINMQGNTVDVDGGARTIIERCCADGALMPWLLRFVHFGATVNCFHRVWPSRPCLFPRVPS